MNEHLLLTPFEAATVSNEIYDIRNISSAELPDFRLLEKFSEHRQFEMVHWYEGETGAFGMFDVSRIPFINKIVRQKIPMGAVAARQGGREILIAAGDGCGNGLPRRSGLQPEPLKRVSRAQFPSCRLETLCRIGYFPGIPPRRGKDRKQRCSNNC